MLNCKKRVKCFKNRVGCNITILTVNLWNIKMQLIKINKYENILKLLKYKDFLLKYYRRPVEDKILQVMFNRARTLITVFPFFPGNNLISFSLPGIKTIKE